MSVLDSKTSSITEQAEAYRQLQKHVKSLEGISLAEYQSYDQDKKNEIKKQYEKEQSEKIEQNKIDEAKKNMDEKNSSIFSTKKERDDARKIYVDLINEKKAREENARVAQLSKEEQVKYYEELIQKEIEQKEVMAQSKKNYEKNSNWLHDYTWYINDLTEKIDKSNSKIKLCQSTIASLNNTPIEVKTKSTFDDMIKDAQSSIEGFDVESIKAYKEWYNNGAKRTKKGGYVIDATNLSQQQVKDIVAIDKLLNKYNQGKKGSKEYSDILKLNDPETAIKAIEELTKLNKKAEDERLAYMRKKQEDKYQLIEENKKAQIKAINEEEKEYNKKYGATSASKSAFEKRRETVRLNAQFDKEQLDKEFKQWKDDFENGNNKIKFDIEMASLNHQLEITDDVNKKLEIQKTIRQKIIEQQKEELELEKQQAIKEKFGEQALKDYLAGTSTNAQVKEVAQGYDEKINLSTQQMEQENEITDYAERLQRYEEYANGVIEIEKRKAENLRALASGDSVATREEIEIASDLEKEQLAKDLGIEDIPTDIMNLINEITTSSIKNIKQNLDKVLEELEKNKKEAEANIAKANELELSYKEEENKLQEEQNAINQIEDPNAKKEAQIALDEKLAELEQKRSVNTQALITNQNRLSAITATAKKVNEEYKKSLENLDPAQQHWEQTMAKVGNASATLKMVSQSIRLVQQEFGDLLSEGANDAMSTILLISDVTTGMLDGVKFSALASKEGIKSVEGASAILAIISAAIQVVMAIVNVLMKYFSAEAKQKAQMEEYNRRID